MRKLFLAVASFLLGFLTFFLIYKLFLEPDVEVAKTPQKTVENNTSKNKIVSQSSNANQNNTNENNNGRNNNSVEVTTKNSDGSIKTPENVIEPTYVNGVMIVNKKHPLPKTYNKGEDPSARVSVNKLIADMQRQGMNVSNNVSGFRSFAKQSELYNTYVARSGQAQADTFSARPGYSEHQSGLAFDLIDNQGQLLGSQGTTESSMQAANWLSHNAHKYGFIVRYKAEITEETGYQAESWHLRYVGDNIAKEIYEKNISLERYLGVEGGTYQ